MENTASPAVVKRLLQEYGFRFSKSLGQNFLIDEDALERIVAGAGVNETSCVLEIGPGFGALTQRLCTRARKVCAVELDTHAVAVLQDVLAEYDNLSLVQGDVLKLNLPQLLQQQFGGEPVQVVANLPYYITTPILMMLIESRLPLESITVMVQKEVADRMVAAPGKKDYGALSVAVQYRCAAHIVTTVGPGSFLPPPKVSSSVVRLDMRDTPPVEVTDEKQFFRVVRASFATRRKTLPNALAAGGFTMAKGEIAALLEGLGIDPMRRGETLSLQEFAAISEKIV